jgi:hypothetical protein
MTAGGPDPQVRLTGEAIQRHRLGGELHTACDLAGLFVVPYSCAGAAILWRLYEKKPVETWQPWLEQHGSSIPVRKERRPVKGSWPRFTECAKSWLDWCYNSAPHVTSLPYRDVYKSVTSDVKYFGRYATMKLLETMYQAGITAFAQDTMVPRDGKFPRRTMALLMPEHSEMLLAKGPGNEAEIDALCDRIRQGTSDRIGQEISWFQIETMLCIYRQSLGGKYPGGRHDSELGHWWRTIQAVGPDISAQLHEQFPFHRLRGELYPHEYLGEFNDPQWWGIRPELEEERKVMLHAVGIA